MANPSNLYAERIYAEHPTLFWALDDNADYTKLMSDARLTLHTPTTFSKNNIQTTIGITNFSAYQTPPIPDAPTTEIEFSTFANPWGTSKVASIYPSSPTTIDSNVSSFTISFYYYAATPYISSIKVGYLVGSTLTDSETFTVDEHNSWQFISKTFSNPTTQATKLYLEFTYSENPVLNGTTDDYIILINGLSMGYSSEEFNKNSVGISQSTYTALDLNTTISGFNTTTYGVVADAYGISDTGSNGYYCVLYNKLLAKNSGLPMIFGSSNSTIVYPNPSTTDPSLIFPAYGFLNQTGRNNLYTFEFWLKTRAVKNNAVHKIFGPVSSTDGLYINKNSMVLKIGKKSGSYYVGEWYRPMLIDIKYSPTQASLMVNGETVVSFSLDSVDLSLFPEEIVSAKNTNWVGFYANSDKFVNTLELDGIAIYPYHVDSSLAKRRYVFAQGVEFSQNINVAYNGKSFFIDYAASNYANNYRYPGIKRWQSRANDNFSIEDGTLSSPSLNLPTAIYSDGKTYANLCLAQNTAASYMINPTGYNGYLSYDSLNVLSGSSVKALVVSATPTSYTVGKNNTIFKLVNKNNGDYFVAKLVPSTTSSAVMTYAYQVGDLVEDIVDASLNYTVAVNTPTTVGIDLAALAKRYAPSIGNLLSNPENLKVYIGNDETFQSSFIGTFFTIGLMTPRNFEKTVSTYFSVKGVMTNTGTGRTASQTQGIVTGLSYSYKLSLINPLGDTSKYAFEIGASSYWEDYVPIKTLAKSISIEGGGDSYELDFIQFNIDYPEPISFVNVSGQDYYDTSGSDVKTYVIFRYLSDGTYVDTSGFTSNKPLKSGTLFPDAGWATSKYEVVDGSIIFLPANLAVGKTINDLAMVISVESNNSTTLSSPIKVRSLELASQAFDDTSQQWSNPIGTKSGEKIYPYTYTIVGSTKTFDSKQKNPYRIYKQTSPYLYLTKDSGVKVLSEFDNLVSDSKGISIPINKGLDVDYNLSSLQMAVRFDGVTFPTSETKIFSLEYEVSTVATTIDFYMIATSTAANRGKIYAKVGSTLFENVFYFLNSNSVANPVLAVGEWANIGIAFDPLLDFDSFVGDLRLVGPLTFNNIAYYQYTGLQDNTKYADQRWNYYQHDRWSSLLSPDLPVSLTWEQVLATTYSAVSGINPIEIYNISIGTNKVIVDNTEDEEMLKLSERSKKIVGSVEWQSKTLKPV
jgi:hypothetical protein